MGFGVFDAEHDLTPPLTVWVPIEDTAQASLSSEDAVVLDGWQDTNRADSPSMYMSFFKLDHSTGEQPNHCHAQQVVTILYTGETDDVARRTCLQDVPTD